MAVGARHGRLQPLLKREPVWQAGQAVLPGDFALRLAFAAQRGLQINFVQRMANQKGHTFNKLNHLIVKIMFLSRAHAHHRPLPAAAADDEGGERVEAELASHWVQGGEARIAEILIGEDGFARLPRIKR